MLTVAVLLLASASPKPLLRDFFGVNGHTVLFKPELYRPVASLVRDYHTFAWDVGKDTSAKTKFPFAENGVNWDEVYGSWKKHGFRTTVSIMFSDTPPASWKNLEKDAYEYGKAFAAYFGPGGKDLVECVEIGNEPKDYTRAQYRKLFESMAKGIRAGDPKMLIGTCAVAIGEKDPYSKDVAVLKGLEELIDVYSIHVYALSEMWPTWKRTFPENPRVDYLDRVRQMSDYRTKTDPTAKLWVTEYGWDGTDKKPDGTGEEAKFIPNTPLEQAQYLVRSTLVFASMDVDRAYMYFFNDEGKSSFHAASGLTTNFEPKPAYYALAHLKQYADYRFSKTVRGLGEAIVQEYVHKDRKDKVLWVGWLATDREPTQTHYLDLPKSPGKLLGEGTRMPAKKPEVVFNPKPFAWQKENGAITLRLSMSPAYFEFEAGK